jgi:hypothetical protein
MRADSIRARRLATVPHNDAGYMTATFPSADRQVPLASRGGPYMALRLLGCACMWPLQLREPAAPSLLRPHARACAYRGGAAPGRPSPLRPYARALRLSGTCDTRSHAYLSRSTIRCSATGTLPSRALGVTLGCEALGTRSPPPDRRATKPRGEVATTSLKVVGSWG